MTVKLEDKVFVFEFKVIGPDMQGGSALEQIRRKHYEDNYTAPGVVAHLIGVEFEPRECNIVGFAWEKAREVRVASRNASDADLKHLTSHPAIPQEYDTKYLFLTPLPPQKRCKPD